MSTLDRVAAAAIVVFVGHELHHLVLGDAAHAGVKSYEGLPLYALLLIVLFFGTRAVAARTHGVVHATALGLFAVGVLGIAGSLSFIGLRALARAAALVLGPPQPPPPPDAFAGYYPWLALTTVLQATFGVPLLVLAARELWAARPRGGPRERPSLGPGT